MFIKVLTVGELNNYIKKVFDKDFILGNVNLKGEISNFKRHSSGHLYFSLKDDISKINCVMFKTNADFLEFDPEDGQSVEIKGRVSTYLKDGSYQLYCNEMKNTGQGNLYEKFVKLKNKLQNEGLFDTKYKKEIPKNPRRIGVITSPTGAAVRDIIKVATRRNKNVDILLYPSLVQGQSAAEDLIKGITKLNSISDIDVIILGRGGGSLEELWSFNDENLAYAIFNSKVPIVTGVGHETDFTIADFVSDYRASTPSAAAEVVVNLLEYQQNEINRLKDILNLNINAILKSNLDKLNNLNNKINLYSPINNIINSYEYLEILKEKMYHYTIVQIMKNKELLSKNYALLNAYNPLNVLDKGYSLIYNQNGTLITSVDSIKNEQTLKLKVKDGEVNVDINLRED